MISKVDLSARLVLVFAKKGNIFLNNCLLIISIDIDPDLFFSNWPKTLRDTVLSAYPFELRSNFNPWVQQGTYPHHVVNPAR